MDVRPPIPPFIEETARQKVQAAEDAWNTRDPERVALALDDEGGHLDGLELGQASLLRLPRRVKREREAEHGRSACLARGAAGDAGA